MGTFEKSEIGLASQVSTIDGIFTQGRGRRSARSWTTGQPQAIEVKVRTTARSPLEFPSGTGGVPQMLCNREGGTTVRRAWTIPKRRQSMGNSQTRDRRAISPT